jgi:phage-related protein
MIFVLIPNELYAKSYQIFFCTESNCVKGSVVHKGRQYDTWQRDLMSAVWAKSAAGYHLVPTG